jgi:hypothetical protein
MNKNRQTKLNNKKRKQNEAKKQEVIEHKQQALTRKRELEYRQASRSREIYLDSIVPRNHEGRRQITGGYPLDLGWGGLLEASSLIGALLRVEESDQNKLSDLQNVIDHNPDEFKE